MPSIPHLTKSDVLRWTDKVYFQRGQKYFDKGAIYDQRRQEMTLRSKCSGTQAPFYRQEVEFDNKGIKSADCSCPVGDGGYCKHAVALLLTWVHNPDSFQEVEAFDATLEKRSKAELIVLIKQMLDQEPDLESLLDLPFAAEESKPLDIKAIRRQAQQAFHGIDDYEWGYTRDIKKALNPLLSIAAVYLAHNDSNNASLIYEVIIKAILDEEHVALDDEEGTLLGVIYDCCETLGQCLDSSNNTKERYRILQVLFSAYRWDALTMGGVGAADCVPEILTSKTMPDERSEIAEWTREILPQGSSWSDGYHREVLGRLLLDLEADILDDEAYLNVCRETGRLNDLVERLLQLKRLNEAEQAARAAEDFDLWKVLDIFTKHEQVGLAENLVTERLETVEDDRLIEWLSNRLEQKGDLVGSLELKQRLFWNYPNTDKYEKIRQLAEKLNRWDDLRAQIITELENKKEFNFLVNIYLLEKDSKNAIAALEKIPARWGDHSLHIEVARAAKGDYPQDAMRIFTKEAERFIEHRNRDSYSQAAQCLYEVRDIYRQLNNAQAWDKMITDIRERYRRLPALQDELNKRKL